VARLSDAAIIGVVTDAKLQGLDETEPYGEVYLPLPEPGRRAAFTVLLRTSGDPDLVAAAVARRLRTWDAGVSVTAAESLRTSVWGSVKPRTFNTVLYGSLAAAALVLVAVGIAGLVATAVARRQREIGIRMALGADGQRVRRLVVLENVRPVIAGLVIGAIASYWTAELVKASLYATTPYDWTVWTATILTVLTAAILAAYIPARRASRVNPISVLRAD
jgi:ABC-type antimicrobial peptide transport system permease subunit